MVTALLIIIYAVFIGLGLPDSVLGSAWPAIYADLNLPVGNASILTMLMSICTAVASYFSARLINKFGTGLITTVSTMLTALALLGFSLSNSMLVFCIMGIPLGLGAGAIDSALNNYVATRYKSAHMNFLHAFYGVGVMASPFILSFTLNGLGGWRAGYRLVFIIQTVIFVLSAVALPLWKKVKESNKNEENFTPVTLKLKQMVKMPAVRVAWVVFFATCALEFTCGTWGTTYLASSQGMSESISAKYLTLYFGGITASRFISGLISNKVPAKYIVFTGSGIAGIGILLILLPVPPTVKGLCLLLIGLGNGPTFPNLTYLTPTFFGRDISQSIVGTIMVMCNLGICLMPPAFGLIAQYFDIGLFPYFIAVCFAVMLVFEIVYVKMPKQKSSDIKF
ncbi:MAG: MFS transporter [Clostridia bacterium]|nr:MFS transporter [Clostridia bacterium]